MIQKFALPALLVAAAFAGASVAFASPDMTTSTPATSTTTLSPPVMGPSMSSAHPSKIIMPDMTSTRLSMTKSAMPESSDMGSTEKLASQAPAPASMPAAMSSPEKSYYVDFSDIVRPGDIAAFTQHKISLNQAIENAAARLHGTAVEAVFKQRPHGSHYIVWVTQIGRVLTADVNPYNGKVTPVGPAVATRRLDPSERSDFDKTQTAEITLAQAVSFARKQTGYSPISAAMQTVDHTNGYQVAVADHGVLHEIWVAPNNPASKMG